MDKFESLEDVAAKLGDGGPHNPDVKFETVGQLVDALVELGNTPEVYVSHDDYLGLKSELSSAFLQTPLDQVDPDQQEEEIKLVLEQANTIVPLSEREITEDLQEEIREDMRSRGANPDD